MTLRQIGFAALVASWVTQGALAQDIPWTMIAPLCSSVLLTKRLPETPQNAPADIRITVDVCADLERRKVDVEVNGTVHPAFWERLWILQCVTREIEVILDEEIQKRRALNLSPATLIENVIARVQSESERIISGCLWSS